MSIPKGWRHSPESREKIRQALLGKPKSPEAVEKMRQALRGKTLKPEHVEAMRRARLGQKRTPEQRERIRQSKLGKKRSPQACEAMRQANQQPEAKERRRQARLRRTFRQKMTSIELALYAEFKKRRLKFEMHKTMFGRFQPDFVFEQAKLVVEADGDYWHSLPKAREREVAFNAAAITEGWSVWRFGEREIQMHAAICARAVARFVRSHR